VFTKSGEIAFGVMLPDIQLQIGNATGVFLVECQRTGSEGVPDVFEDGLDGASDHRPDPSRKNGSVRPGCFSRVDLRSGRVQHTPSAV
jgi:hypothetical protein